MKLSQCADSGNSTNVHTLGTPDTADINQPLCISTGVRASPHGLHLGHFVGNVQPLLSYPNEQRFFIIADVYPTCLELQRDTVNASIAEIIGDCLACVPDPSGIDFVLQSSLEKQTLPLRNILCELATNRQIERVHPKRQDIRSSSLSMKLSDYLFPLQQATDILALMSSHVASNIDNLALVDFARSLARKLNNHTDQKILPLPTLIHGPVTRVIGYNRQKMSKSNQNCIYLSSSPEELRLEIDNIFIFPNRVSGRSRRKLERNLAFHLIEALSMDDHHSDSVRSAYETGEATESDIHELLLQKLQSFLAPIAERRHYIESHPDLILETLRIGTANATLFAARNVQRTVDMLDRQGIL